MPYVSPASTSYPVPPPPGPSSPQPMKTYSHVEAVFAILTLAFGYLYIRLITHGPLGVGATVLMLLFCVTAIAYMKISRASIAGGSWFWLLIIVLFSLNFTITGNRMLKNATLVFVVAATAFWFYAACHGRGVASIRRTCLYDGAQAIFVQPFAGFGDCPSAIAHGGRSPRQRYVRLILLGLLIALPLTLAIGAILVAADDAFAHLIDSVFHNFYYRVLRFMIEIVLGVPIAFYLFGMLYTGVHRRNAQDDSAAESGRMLTNLRVAPPVLLYTVALPIALLYIAFFVSQSAYYFSAFSELLPEGFTYAAYARRGFFELCVLAVVNLLLITAANLFCRRGEKKPLGLRLLSVVFSLFTLLLIATAMRKMMLYIEQYGLTLKRVTTSWFMLLLAVLFLFIIVNQFVTRLPFARCAVATGLLFFALLSFSNVDGLIAKYNVEQYMSGRLEEVDISLFYDLSESAVPYVLPLRHHEDPQIADEVETYLDWARARCDRQGPLSFNFAAYRAKTLLETEK